MAYQLFEANLKMKKPPPKQEETKVIEKQEILASKSEVISKSSNSVNIKKLDTITEEDENLRESVRESKPLSVS